MPKRKSSSQSTACSVRATGLRGSSSLYDQRVEAKDRSKSSLAIRQSFKRKADSVSEVLVPTYQYLSYDKIYQSSLIFMISDFGPVFDYGVPEPLRRRRIGSGGRAYSIANHV